MDLINSLYTYMHNNAFMSMFLIMILSLVFVIARLLERILAIMDSINKKLVVLTSIEEEINKIRTKL